MSKLTDAIESTRKQAEQAAMFLIESEAIRVAAEEALLEDTDFGFLPEPEDFDEITTAVTAQPSGWSFRI